MRRNKAFTIAEIILVFVFIGVISVIALHTMNNRFTDYFTRYYTAYDALSKASYNTYIDTYCRNASASEDGTTDCSAANNEDGIDYTGSGRPFPTKIKDLKKRLAEYLNVTQETKDSEAGIAINNADDEDFNDKTLQLTLTNGFRLYFSGLKEINFVQGTSSNNKTVQFFIVYVDLNGTAKPNRVGEHPDFATEVSPKPAKTIARPDIVPFAITTKGEVIPVGFPVFDRSYATARLSDSDGNQSKSYTLDEARQLAYGIFNPDPAAIKDYITRNNITMSDYSEMFEKNHCRKKYCYFSDMPITLMPLFNKELPKRIRPKETDWPKEYIDNAKAVIKETGKEKYIDCDPGSFTCVVNIDENTGKRF